MVRSHRRRFGAALLATVLCGMLAVVDARPTAAVIASGDISDVAMYVVSSSGNVMRIGPDGTVTFLATGLGSIGQGIAAAQDGTLYVTSPPGNTVWKIAPGGSPAAVPFTATVTSPQDVAVDDTGAVYTVSTGTAYIVKRASNGAETTIPYTAAIVAAMAVDHDGSHIYLFDLMNGEIVRMDADGGNRTVVVGFHDIPDIQAFTVDDQQRVYAGTASGHVYRITQGPGPNTIDDLTSAVGSVTDVSVTDNGEIFATRFTSTDVVRVHSDGSVEQMVDQVPSPIALLVRAVPGAPTSFQATPADGAADVSFVPGAPGGDPNQSFETSIDSEASWQPLTTQPGTAGTLTGTVANLPNGVQSTILLRAYTSVGNSPNASTTVTATSPSPSPSPSTTSPSPSPSPSTTSPSPSPSPSTTSPSPSPSPSTTSPTPPATTSPTPSPSPSTTSASPSPSPAPTATVPNTPTGVTATARTSSIEVSWQPPADNGIAITGYRVIADPGPAVCTTTGATNCVLGGAAGTTYRVRVVALSAKGISKLSVYSNTAVPTAPTVSATPPATNVPLNTDQGKISATTPGQGITLVGSGYAAYSTVTLTVYSTPTVLGQTRTDENGTFRQAVTVPGDLDSGRHSFTATGVDPGGKPRTMRMDVTVRPATSKLPVTGTAVMWLIVTGLGITMAGVGLRLVRR
ncbi:fibronectin type III domain-containing protein [Actinoplanes sp. NPDC051513]|uniref:fibronectin type III domain-containing protein n=1 Tax=Actinoplanes sp. NPDC051513 TaxID=3363908 RepID=UPI003791A77F